MEKGIKKVNKGGKMGGKGKIGGEVKVERGGEINKGSFGMEKGKIKIKGDIKIERGQKKRLRLGKENIKGGNLNDMINVGGDIVIEGKIKVDKSEGGKMDNGIYRVLKYKGKMRKNEWKVNIN